MGIASYREDIFLRFLESTDKRPPIVPELPPTHYCPFCTEGFVDTTSLTAHLSQRHHGTRPVLFIGGREPDQISVIRETLSSDQIVILPEDAAAHLRMNGEWVAVRGTIGVKGLLSRERDAEITVDLVHRFDPVADPIHQLYQLWLRIPDKISLDAVDLAFLDHLAAGEPNMGQVASFLCDDRCSGLVNEYADALATYVRGLLIRDQAFATGVTLAPAESDDLYGQSLDVLRAFSRPLPMVICGLIRFAFNDFNTADQPTGFERLDRCNGVLGELLGRGIHSSEDRGEMLKASSFGLCPIDQAIDRVLDLAGRLNRQTRWGPALTEECRQTAGAGTLPARERIKAQALWAATAMRLGAETAAAEPLRQLRSSFPFDEWAAGHLDRIEG